MPPPWRTHGTGEFDPSDLGGCGEGCVFEPDVLIFNAAHVFLDRDVYIGHRAMLKGDTRNRLEIGAGSWVGQNVYMHSAGGIRIGSDVGIGPGTMILTSTHEEVPSGVPILHGTLQFASVVVGDGSDLGIGSIILPGVRLGRGVQVGAGSVVVDAFPDEAVIAGVPAKLLRRRGGQDDA